MNLDSSCSIKVLCFWVSWMIHQVSPNYQSSWLSFSSCDCKWEHAVNSSTEKYIGIYVQKNVKFDCRTIWSWNVSSLLWNFSETLKCFKWNVSWWLYSSLDTQPNLSQFSLELNLLHSPHTTPQFQSWVTSSTSILPLFSGSFLRHVLMRSISSSRFCSSPRSTCSLSNQLVWAWRTLNSVLYPQRHLCFHLAFFFLLPWQNKDSPYSSLEGKGAYSSIPLINQGRVEPTMSAIIQTCYSDSIGRVWTSYSVVSFSLHSLSTDDVYVSALLFMLCFPS